MERSLEEGYFGATVSVTAILVIILNFLMLWQAPMIPDGDDVLFRQVAYGHDTFYRETVVEHSCHDRNRCSFLSGLESFLAFLFCFSFLLSLYFSLHFLFQILLHLGKFSFPIKTSELFADIMNFCIHCFCRFHRFHYSVIIWASTHDP